MGVPRPLGPSYSGPPVHSLRTAAHALGRPVAQIEQAWAALGLTVADVDQVALSQEDVEGLRTWSELSSVVGAATSLGVLRVLGASMARFAEAVSSAIRGGVPAIQLNYTEDELTTARAYAGVTSFVPRVGRLLDAVHRQRVRRHLHRHRRPTGRQPTASAGPDAFPATPIETPTASTGLAIP